MSATDPTGTPAPTATAEVEEQELLKTMSWWDGFLIALANPGFLLAALGGSISALGTTGAMILWTASVLLGTLQNNIYAELAAMFPNKTGGIALYAHEAWRRYFSPIGAIASFGYWFAWSTVLSISGLISGTLVMRQFFPDVTWGIHAAHFNLDWPIIIAIAMLLLVWWANARGTKSSVAFTYVTGAALVVPLLVMMIAPYLTGDWQSSNMEWRGGSGGSAVGLVITWMYFMGWSAYGFEACATVAPEYRDTVHDTSKALRTAAAFSVLVYALLPLGVGGTLGTDVVAADSTAISFYTNAFEAIGGNLGADFLVLCMVGGVVLTMSTATIDGSRAIYGISRDGMTIKWFNKLNKHQVPGRGMMVDAVMNIFLAVFFGSALAIVAAGNLGYMLAHFFALSGFLLLRRDRPEWPRPIRLSRIWVPIAWFAAGANLVFIVGGGVIFAQEFGYGLAKTGMGAAVLLIAVALFVYRRVVEDKQPLQWREQTPLLPETTTQR